MDDRTILEAIGVEHIDPKSAVVDDATRIAVGAIVARSDYSGRAIALQLGKTHNHFQRRLVGGTDRKLTVGDVAELFAFLELGADVLTAELGAKQ